MNQNPALKELVRIIVAPVAMLLTIPVLVIIGIAIVGGSDNATITTARTPAELDSIKSRLRIVGTGDFVEFNGKWHIVTATNFASGSRYNAIAIIAMGDLVSTMVYYEKGENLERIGKIIRWTDGNKEAYADAAYAYATQK